MPTKPALLPPDSVPPKIKKRIEELEKSMDEQLALIDIERIRMKPSQGRIVIYHHPGSLDGKYPPTTSPAIIQNVAEDGSCTLFVFGPKGQHMDSGLVEGKGPCQWSWPERV